MEVPSLKECIEWFDDWDADDLTGVSESDERIIRMGQRISDELQKLHGLEGALLQMTRNSRSLEKRLEAVKKQFFEFLDQENIPRKYYEDKMIYGVYGTSSIDYVEVLRGRLTLLKDKLEWSGPDISCPLCGEKHPKHKEDCIWLKIV